MREHNNVLTYLLCCCDQLREVRMQSGLTTNQPNLINARPCKKIQLLFKHIKRNKSWRRIRIRSIQVITSEAKGAFHIADVSNDQICHIVYPASRTKIPALIHFWKIT